MLGDAFILSFGVQLAAVDKSCSGEVIAGDKSISLLSIGNETSACDEFDDCGGSIVFFEEDVLKII
jgi:hypothetical protein